MPNVSNDAIVEVVIHSTLAEQRQMTVLHYRITDMSAPADQFTLLSDIDDRLALADGVYDAIADASGQDAEFQEVQIQWIHPVRYAYRKFASMPLIGQFAADCLPPACHAALTKRGVEATRRHIGAVHLPNQPISAADDGKWIVGWMDVLNTLGTRLKTPYNLATVGTITPVILNKDAPGSSVTVETVVVQPEVRVSRRRTVGLGI